MVAPGIDYPFEDWKMAKDRIKHFDDVVVRIRLQGIGIAATIMSIGVASVRLTGVVRIMIGGLSVTGVAAIVFLGSLYLIPVAALDWFHYELLILSVERALEVENDAKYKGQLCITNKLTSPRLTRIHTSILIAVYVGLFAFGVVLAIFLNSLPSAPPSP